MKRKSLLFLLLMAMFAPLAMNGQTLVQVTSLEVGETYVIAKGNYAMGNTTYGSSGALTAVSFNSSDSPGDNILWTIESGNATNGYIFKNVGNNKYLGLNSNEYLDVVNSGTAMRYDGTDLINNVDSEGYYYVSLTSDNTYFTTSKNTGQNIVMYKYTSGGGQGGGNNYVWVETTTITPNEEYLIGFVNNGNVYLAVNYATSETNHYYTDVSSTYYGYTAQATIDGNGYVTGVSGYATDLRYCTWKFSTSSGGTITSGYESSRYLYGWTSSTSYNDLYPNTSSTTWTYSSSNGRLYANTSYYADYYSLNSNPHMQVTSNPSSTVKLYTKQLVETGYAVNAGTMSNGSIQFSINGGYDWYDNLSNVAADETVVISVEPETGYELQGTPTVTPASGTAPTVSGSGNLYSFVMPESDVTVNATFNCTTPADPTFSVAGGTYTTVQNVTISCATAGATIYYTTDGSTPNSSSTQYTGAITINSTTTLKAIAYIGTCASGVTTATYTMDLPTYTVTCATGLTGGSIAASPATAVEGTTITITVTPESGYFLGTITATDGNNNDVPVTIDDNTGTFTMPNSNVTVTATFTQGFHVTLVQTANGTISADQTTNLQPGDHVTLTATPDNGCVFLAWYVYKSGNPRDVISVVNNEWFFMPSSDVTVQAVFVTEEEHEQTVGSGTNTSSYLPTYVYRRTVCHSLTQQIYTAAEIGYNGRITAIAFKANGSVTRNLDIYMAHTDKTSFSSNTDWEVMGSVAKVYSGSVSFTNNWTTITLDTPFEYDGTSNLNICVVDVTSGQVSNTRAFSAYSTGVNRAMYVYSTGSSATDYSTVIGYSNQLESTTGTRSTSNNQIKFTIKVPGSAESLTISPDEINDFSYVEGQGPSQTHKLDIVGVDLENNITLTAPANFKISLTESGSYTSTLTIPRETGSKGNRDVQTWDFEDGLQGWTVTDADGDGYNWAHNTSFGGHDGSTGILFSQSYDNTGGALTPDNWLISPQVILGGSFSMWAHPQQAAYPAEHFAILVSTTNTNTSSFTMLGEWTLSSGDWKQFSVDLSAYAEQTGYIAVRHYNCTDQFYINVDDFVLDTDAAITVEMPVTITPATVFVRMEDNLNRGSYNGTLTASAGTGDNLNCSVSLSGVVIAPSYNITLIANPYDGGNAEGGGTFTDGTSVTVTATTRGNYSFINWTENGTEVSTNASYTFTVNADRTLVANFGFIKHIIGRTTGGYQLIASPIGQVAPANVTNMTANSFDLYRYNANATLQWENYKQVGDDHYHFDLYPGRGYLYANSETVDLVFMGQEYSGNTLQVSLNAQSASGFKNWNLVGNPFAEIAHIETAQGQTLNYYTLEYDEVGEINNYVVATPTSIEPMEGVFVIASVDRETITFARGESETKSSQLALNINSSRNLVDRAIVRFDECRQLPKFQLNEDYTKVYIPMDGEEYAVVHGEEMGELPVNFKAEENGHYSLSLSSENVEFAYLHLIDNLTGNEVDLLQTPSYIFEAKTTDYASRFKLVYATGDNSNSDNFAFFSNGGFVINNDGVAELQVIDLMGRILSSETINGCTNVSVNAAPGVYMLRLVNGDNVKVQKVVVK